MFRAIRCLVLALMAAVLLGCDGEDGESNPDLKKPNIPPGREVKDGPGVPPPKGR